MFVYEHTMYCSMFVNEPQSSLCCYVHTVYISYAYNLQSTQSSYNSQLQFEYLSVTVCISLRRDSPVMGQPLRRAMLLFRMHFPGTMHPRECTVRSLTLSRVTQMHSVPSHCALRICAIYWCRFETCPFVNRGGVSPRSNRIHLLIDEAPHA